MSQQVAAAILMRLHRRNVKRGRIVPLHFAVLNGGAFAVNDLGNSVRQTARREYRRVSLHVLCPALTFRNDQVARMDGGDRFVRDREIKKMDWLIEHDAFRKMNERAVGEE